VADAARVAVRASSLYEGVGSLTGGAVAKAFGRIAIEILSFTGADGSPVTVPEKAKPYTTEGDVYLNPWLGIRLLKPKGFAFSWLDAVWPITALVEMSGPDNALIRLSERAFPPWVRPEEAAAADLRSATGAEVGRRESKDGRVVLIAAAGETAAAAILDDTLYWQLFSRGKNAAGLLAEVLAGLKIESPLPAAAGRD
jgi:hypothetical protein